MNHEQALAVGGQARRRRFVPRLAGLAMAALALPGLAGLSGVVVAAEGPSSLPQPLTLSAILHVSLDGQYAVMSRRADVDFSQSDMAQVDSWYRPQVTIKGRLRYFNANDVAPDQGDHGDNAIGVQARQNLYDFGRHGHLSDAARQKVAGARLDLLDTEQAQRLAIMRAFFDVLLADQRYAMLNERMAIYYVRYDKAKDRRELGLTSDYDLAKFQREYQDVFLQRSQADAERRITRRRLAELLGRPGQIPQKLANPKLGFLFKRQLPDLDAALKSVLAGDPQLQALRARYTASEDSLLAARQDNMPSIYAQLDGNSYERELGSRDPFRAGLYITFPLYQGGAHNAAVGKAQAERMKLQAAIARRSALLREQTTDLLEMIQVYRGPGLSRIKALENYSDLNFTRKQTLYQMEKATDLGDAMVEESSAQLERMKNDFSLAMNWARLMALEGKPTGQWLASDSADSNRKEPAQ